ncbi:hypothetical protein C8R44DRAFT_896499 [Mycena epipterygia]|nr:hypothetical protein C8R44DRAFT_896499 [Mycena epipterygia]
MFAPRSPRQAPHLLRLPRLPHLRLGCNPARRLQAGSREGCVLPSPYPFFFPLSVIEWLFVVIAVILIGCLFLRKLLGAPRGLHGENPYRHALHPFASSTSISAAPDYLQYGYGYAYLPYPVPAHTTRRAYGVTHPTRRAHDTTQTTRAYDIGVGGRRANGDEELVLGDKDILPVYDAFDRPPQYAYGYDAGPSVNVEPVAVGGWE